MENGKLNLDEIIRQEDEELKKLVPNEDDIKANETVGIAIDVVAFWEKECIKLGDSLPYPKAEAINFLNTYAELYCANRELNFLIRHPNQHESDIKREIRSIERFINNANKYEFPNVAYDRLNEIEKDMFVYQEIISNECSTYFQPYPEFTERYIPIYGRFVLFYDYLKSIVRDSDNNGATPPENDYLLSTIEDYIFPFKDKMSEQDYKTLCKAFKQYFTEGDFPCSGRTIQVSKVNKKSFGWALKELYKSQKNDKLPDEYLQFAKENISIFADVAPENIYKYFTTKP